MLEQHRQGPRRRTSIERLVDDLDPRHRVDVAEDLETLGDRARQPGDLGWHDHLVGDQHPTDPAARIVAACHAVAAVIAHAPSSSWRRNSTGAIVVLP